MLLGRNKMLAGSGPDDRSRNVLRRVAKDLQWASWIALGAMLLFWPKRVIAVRESLHTHIAELEPGRGREARSPGQIPPRGWRDILWRTWRGFIKDQITTVAGGVTFFSLLSIFPGLAAFVALYGLFADFHDAIHDVEALAIVAPHDAVVFIGAQMIRIAEARSSDLSFTFVVSLLLSLWSANSGMKAFLNGLNVAYGEREKRNFLTLTLHSLAFTLGGLLVLLLSVAAMVALPLATPAVDDYVDVLNVLRWPALLAVMILVLAVVYRYGPSREHARWRWVSWGSTVAAVLWLVGSLAFSFYMAKLAHYDRTYGSFGAAAGAMVWLWMSVVIVLFGAELNAEIEHQTAVDSTSGPPQPLGRRGAVMADTIGRKRKG